MSKKIISVILALMMSLVVAFSGCIGSSESSASEVSDTIEIVDLLGRTVEVPADVQKIVCSGPGCLRLICYLDATEYLVGIEGFENTNLIGRPYRLAHDEFSELTVIGNGGPQDINVGPDPEKVLNVMPDVIFITYMDADKADELQEKTGVPVVVLSYGALGNFKNDAIFDSLTLSGEILGKEERAQDVISFMTGIQDDLDKRTADIPDEEKPTIYVGAIGNKGVHGIDSTEGAYPPFEALNTENVAKVASTEHLFLSKEQILEWDPEFIFIDEGGLSLVYEDYEKSPEYYESLDAFETGNVYGILPFNYYTTNLDTAMADSYYIGSILYPEAFSDVDPAAKADEIYEFLDGEGVYSEMAEMFGGFEKLNFSNQ
ncbi:periplasmic binding protein [Methanococcus maripaludis C5]|uniref:Periplasmic binding protein n=1 Tax=Methanococcus maripaludis (strain C5 / ATCC BAA-1333) TaxID=402880 RepID=A4FWZ6_METM5|nr:iron ABC transporter substrate-binding protein [Methanococcus maripaludis]ABO34725.1 periplasmic binding protein [Methanococcus maripaludis C5]